MAYSNRQQRRLPCLGVTTAGGPGFRPCTVSLATAGISLAAGNWSGLFGAPRLNLRYTESASWSHSWQTVVDLGGLAWSEYTLMLPGETWGLRCTGEVSLTYHPEVREEPLSQFRHVISAQLIYQAPGSWSSLRISAWPSYFGPQALVPRPHRESRSVSALRRRLGRHNDAHL